MKKTDLLRYYQTRIEEYNKLFAADKRLISWLSLFRLLVFAGGTALTVLFFKLSVLAGAVSLISSIALFAILLKLYADRQWMKNYHSNMLEVNTAEVKSINEDYSDFAGGLQYSDSSHDFSHDIDMFGSGSVFQSVNRCCTERGELMLANWFLNPYKLSSDYYERSEAIRELSEKTDWRQKFSSLGMMNLITAKETDDFLDWIKEEPRFSVNVFYKTALVFFPVLTILLFVLWAVSLISITWFIVLFLINLFLIVLNLGHINKIHSKLTKKSEYLSVVGNLTEHIISENFGSDYLKEQQIRLGAGKGTAVDIIKKLSRILNSFDSRLNMIMGVLLNGVLLWDYQCVIRIERWKINMSQMVPGWFEAISRVDALNSLGYYANNNPGFVYAELSEGPIFLKAEKLGHHLIPSAKRVTNNYSISGKGAINIITGANMAGKSTFLRTLAVNMVFAMLGAPVCAAKFVFTPTDIFTSMRTSDSLTEEESYFFAELKRLRRLIERLNSDSMPFFILDEILKGTNSKDKSEGSRAFLEKVISMGGTGLIATHDISLGLLEEDFPEKVSNNCFEIEIYKGRVKFDFILRKGITSKMNAALLMKQQGII